MRLQVAADVEAVMSLDQDVLPKDFIDHLRAEFSGLQSLPFAHQFEIARMVWGAPTKGRLHREFCDAFSFHYVYLEAAFGRGGFSRINDDLKLFDVSANWSAKDQWTRWYRFSPKLEACFDRYRRLSWSGTTALLTAENKTRKTILKAVASKNLCGSDATIWPDCCNLNRVPVCLDTLEELRAELAELLNGSTDRDEFAYKIKLNRWFSATACVIRFSMTSAAGLGVMPHRYVEAKGGRLYAQGLSLQNAPRLVKAAALAESWEYDFSNCHYTIFEQMSRRYGYFCSAIPEYLGAKKAVRKEIAAQAGISEAQAKECLIAIMYGASTTLWHKNSIPREIGAEAAERLFSVPFFKALRREIKDGSKMVLSRWPRTANGRLTNEVGKAIESDARPMQKMAHLIQGVEAHGLKCALQLFPDEIVLLQHDGFTARTKLCKELVVDRIAEASGYQLSLEEEKVHFSRSQVAAMACEEEQKENWETQKSE